MLLCLQKYNLDIHYIKGKYLHVADTLSRAHQQNTVEDIDNEEIQLAVHTLIDNLLIYPCKKCLTLMILVYYNLDPSLRNSRI